MSTLHIGKISPGDTLVCCQCDHERTVDQAWIDKVCERHFLTRHPPRIHDSDLGRFQCSHCRSKKLVKRTRSEPVAAPRPPANRSATHQVAEVSADPSRYQIATAYIDQASDEERAALLFWANQLMAIRVAELPALEKATRAIRVTIESGAIRPFVQFLGTEIKRVGWDERGLPERLALGSAAAAALVFAGQGAGIAALGGAIGVPLWVVFGAGGAFAGVVIEEVKRRGSSPPRTEERSPKPRG